MKEFLLKYKKHYIKLLFAILALIIFLKLINIKDYSFILKSLSNPLFWYACTLLIIGQMIRALRFQILLSEYHLKPPFLKNILIHFTVSILGMITPSKIGEAAKLWLVGEKKEKAGFCFLLEKTLDMSTLFLLGAIGVYLYTIFINSLYFLIPIIVLSVIALFYFDRIFNFFFQKLFNKKLGKNWFIYNIKLFIKLKHLFTILLGAAIRLIDMYATYQFALIAGFNISFFEFIPVFSSAIMIGFVSGFPGGIGSREVATGFLFLHIFDINIKTSAMFSIISLFGISFTFIFIGVPAYVLLKRNYLSYNVKI